MFEDDYFVTIALEDSEKRFTVQKALLCSVSPYFTSALQGSFREAGDRTLRLPGCEEETFQLVLYWISHRRFPNFVLPVARLGRTSETDDTFVRNLQVLCVKTWLFGDAYLMPKLQNEAMRGLTQIFTRHYYVQIEAIRLAFEGTASGTVLRAAILRNLNSDCKKISENKEVLGGIPGLFADFIELQHACENHEGQRCTQSNCLLARVIKEGSLIVPEDQM